jgi:hypothetical protein
MATRSEISILERLFDEGLKNQPAQEQSAGREALGAILERPLAESFFTALAQPSGLDGWYTTATSNIKVEATLLSDEGKAFLDSTAFKVILRSAKANSSVILNWHRNNVVLKPAPAPAAPAPSGGPRDSFPIVAAPRVTTRSNTNAGAAASPPSGNNDIIDAEFEDVTGQSSSGRSGSASAQAAQPAQQQAGAGTAMTTEELAKANKVVRTEKGIKYNADGLPVCSPKIDRVKVAAHLSLNWRTAFWKWYPANAMRPRAFGIVEPVIDAIDQKMEDLGLSAIRGRDGKISGIGSILQLDSALLATLTDSTKDAAAILDKFSTDNKDKLSQCSTYLAKLRQHIEITYKTNKERTTKKNKKGEVIKEGKDETLWRSDLTTEQKQTLLAHIDEMEQTFADLLKGSKGVSGAEALANLEKIKRGEKEWSVDNVRNSVSGLSKASFLTNNAFARSTGKFPNNSDANHSWKQACARSIDIGYHDPSPHTTPILYSDVNAGNLERTWQNHFIDVYAARDENNRLKVNFQQVVEAKLNFVSVLLPFVRKGYAHEAIFSVRQLARLAQAPGTGDTQILPPPDSIVQAVDALRLDVKDPKIAKFVDHLKKLSSAEITDGSGAARKRPWDPWGLIAKYFDDNRINRHRAEVATYFFEYSERWRSTGRLTTPSKNYLIDRFVGTPLRMMAAFFKGAHDWKVPDTSMWGVGQKDYRSLDVNYKAKGADGKAAEESSLAVIRRALIRPILGALVNDWKASKWTIRGKTIPVPWKIIPSNLGYAALLSGALWAGGQGLNHATNDGFDTFLGTTVMTNIGSAGTSVTLGIADGISHLTWGTAATYVLNPALDWAGKKTINTELGGLPTDHITAARNWLHPQERDDSKYEGNYTPREPAAEGGEASGETIEIDAEIRQLEEEAEARKKGRPATSTPQAERSEPAGVSVPEKTIDEEIRQLEEEAAARKSRAPQASYRPSTTTPTTAAFARVVHSPAHVNAQFNGVSWRMGNKPLTIPKEHRAGYSAEIA